jgi:hypothetical protein
MSKKRRSFFQEEEIPLDTIAELLSYLPYNEILNASGCCKYWRGSLTCLPVTFLGHEYLKQFDPLISMNYCSNTQDYQEELKKIDFSEKIAFSKEIKEVDKKGNVYYCSLKYLVDEFVHRFHKSSEALFRETFVQTFPTFIDIKTLLLFVIYETNTHDSKFLSNAILSIACILSQYAFDVTIFPSEKQDDQLFKIALNFIEANMNSIDFSISFSCIISKIEISKGFHFAHRCQRQTTFIKSKVKIDELPSIEQFARQLTIHEYKTFRAMKPSEFCGVSWRRSPKKSVNVHNELQEFDKVSLWVANVIVGETNINRRAEWVNYFLKLGQTLLELRNFQTLFAIVGGLTSAAVFRLSKTFDLLDIASKDTLEKFRSIVSIRTNFALHRAYLKQEEGKTCIPFMGMILSDLKAIREGYDANLPIKDESLVHWMSLTQEYQEVISQVLKWQHQGFPNVNDVAWIESDQIQKTIERNFEDLIDWKKLYQISVEELEARVQ